MDSAKQKFNEAYDKTKNTEKDGKPSPEVGQVDEWLSSGTDSYTPARPQAGNLHPSKESGNEVTPNLASKGSSSTDKESHGGGGGLLSSMFSGSGGDAAR